MSVKEELQDLKVKIAVMETSLSAHKVQISEKIDNAVCELKNVSEKITGLPCKERIAILDSIKSQVRFQWMITGGVVLAIIAEWARKK